MKKFWIQIALLLMLIFILLFMASRPEVLKGLLNGNFKPVVSSEFETKKLKVGTTLISVEIADTTPKRSQGLSGRESLPSGSGMLFVFDSPRKYQFWMKGMRFPLDMIFIRNGKVVDILENVPNPVLGTADKNLPVYQPTTEIDMVLEVNSGFVKQSDTRIGDDLLLVQS